MDAEENSVIWLDRGTEQQTLRNRASSPASAKNVGQKGFQLAHPSLSPPFHLRATDEIIS
jgi:hypothetical protein